MKVTLKKLLNSVDSLKWLSQQRLKPRYAFALARVINEANKHIEIFQGVRDKTARELGEEVEGKWRVKEENRDEFEASMADLIENTECDMPDLGIPADMLGEITAAIVMALDWLLKYNGEDAEEPASRREHRRKPGKERHRAEHND